MAYDPKYGTEEQYERGIQRHIRGNARKTAQKKLVEWLKIDDHQELHDWLFGVGEFESTIINSAEVEMGGLPQYKHNPLTKGIFAGAFGEFLLELHNCLDNYGKLSPKQTEIVRNTLAKKRKWLEEADQRRKDERASRVNEFIGEVGLRREFEGVVRFVAFGEGAFGLWWLTVIDTDLGTVVYKNKIDKWNDDGTYAEATKGSRVKFVARIKSHDVKEGEKQTVVQRATKIKFMGKK